MKSKKVSTYIAMAWPRRQYGQLREVRTLTELLSGLDDLRDVLDRNALDYRGDDAVLASIAACRELIDAASVEFDEALALTPRGFEN